MERGKREGESLRFVNRRQQNAKARRWQKQAGDLTITINFCLPLLSFQPTLLQALILLLRRVPLSPPPPPPLSQPTFFNLW